MEDIMKDGRFSDIALDPRFKRIPKLEQKIKIDKRFQSMFKDKRFKINYTVDKRGCPISRTSNEDLKRYYAVSSDEDSESEATRNDSSDTSTERNKDRRHTYTSSVKVNPYETGEDGSTGVLDNIKSNSTEDAVKQKECSINFIGLKNNVLVSKVDQQTWKCDLKWNTGSEVATDTCEENDCVADSIKKKLRDLAVDYARGEGLLFSDSSSDDESSETGSEDEELDHGWGELDYDAEGTDEATSRLAVCNMDWDRIRASDLMVLFSSFLPQGGLIHSVMIYPSEFGLKRMEEEEIKGPLELLGDDSSIQNREEQEDGEETEEGSRYHMEKLRQYQLNRLKYYYCILVCDCPATANKIYTECDGLEYESSATRLDLRFVPDGITFDQEPRDVCDKLPDLSKYQPRHFTTTALQQVKVELTWDETNPVRSEISQKLMSGQVDGITETDLRDYLASSSGEESDEAVHEELEKANENLDDPVSKYRTLLQGIEEQEEQKKFRDVEMEVSWGVGLKDMTEELVQKRLKERKGGLTPFEQYLEKRKAKRNQKKEVKKENLQQESEFSGNEHSDDIPSDIDLNDRYFKEEFQEGFKKSNNKKKTKKPSSSDDEQTKQRKAELELLLMDEGTERNHFSLKSIQAEEVEGRKRHKRKYKKELIKEERVKDDDFEVNVKDERFSALFSSHHFNIDPTDSHYHKTKGMEALRAEKLQRRQCQMNEVTNGLPAKIQKMDAVCGKDPELSLLVKAVKRKTQSLHKGSR